MKAEDGTLGAVETVSRFIVEAIREGRLAPGQRLAELELARELGVGRNTVREAVQRLGADGILTVERFRRPAVRKLSRVEVLELFDIREMLEGLAARKAAAAGPAAAELLHALQLDLRSAAEEGDVERFVPLNTRFHATLVDAAGNGQLRDLTDRLSLPIFRLQFRVLLRRDLLLQSDADHARIIAAVRDRDPDAAEAAMRAHIRRAHDNIQGLPDRFFG